MDHQPTLHPNLARLAARYDDIMTKYSRGELDNVVAERQLRELITRDDQGVQWTISPETGRWLRKELRGSWVESVPPEYGYRTASPHDFSEADPSRVNPETRLEFAVVDESRMFGHETLVASTRRALPSSTRTPHGSRSSRRLLWPLLVAAAAAATGAVLLLMPPSDDKPAPVAPSVQLSPSTTR